MDHEISKKIIDNFIIKLDEFKKEHDAKKIEQRKDQLIFQLEKCYEIFVKHNGILREL